MEGKLVCGNCGHEYKIKEGIANFLLPSHLGESYTPPSSATQAWKNVKAFMDLSMKGSTLTWSCSLV